MRLWNMVFVGMLAVAGCAQTKSTAKTASDKTVSTVSDSWITSKIKSKMMWDKAVSSRQINVDTSGGHVYLRGTVDSSSEAEAALQLCLETEGVRSCNSELMYPTFKSAKTFYPGERPILRD